jgi:hypothetical protein
MRYTPCSLCGVFVAPLEGGRMPDTRTNLWHRSSFETWLRGDRGSVRASVGVCIGELLAEPSPAFLKAALR